MADLLEFHCLATASLGLDPVASPKLNLISTGWACRSGGWWGDWAPVTHPQTLSNTRTHTHASTQTQSSTYSHTCSHRDTQSNAHIRS